MYITRTVRLNLGIMRSYVVQEVAVRLALILVFWYMHKIKAAPPTPHFL